MKKAPLVTKSIVKAHRSQKSMAREEKHKSKAIVLHLVLKLKNQRAAGHAPFLGNYWKTNFTQVSIQCHRAANSGNSWTRALVQKAYTHFLSSITALGWKKAPSDNKCLGDETRHIQSEPTSFSLPERLSLYRNPTCTCTAAAQREFLFIIWHT